MPPAPWPASLRGPPTHASRAASGCRETEVQILAEAELEGTTGEGFPGTAMNPVVTLNAEPDHIIRSAIVFVVGMKRRVGSQLERRAATTARSGDCWSSSRVQCHAAAECTPVGLFDPAHPPPAAFLVEIISGSLGNV